MNPRPGDLIGNKYRVVRLIGDGGMGSVHEAVHELLGTSVALKFLHPEIARRPGLASRFLQEARVSARIQSPHVTRVTDVDQTPDGSPFLVMELLTGESLQQLLDRRTKLPKDQAIDFALQILAGLEAAHALGVVHRDLKPDNVFITPSSGGPILKLLDFGIAKLYDDASEHKKGLTRPGAIMGTPEYMAPEQLYSADRVDHRADLFSLGVMLYEMLSGERPAYGDDASAIVGQITAGKIKRLTDHDPALGENLAAAVHKAIASDKGERYESAMAMRLALAPFAGELSQMGRIAATPAPAAVLPSEPPPKKQDKTEELPPLKGGGEKPAARGGVAPTLPPDDEPPAPAPVPAPGPAHPATVGGGDSPQGSTQEASKELIAELSAQRAAQQAAPARTSAPYVGAGAGHYAAAPPMTRPKRKSGLGAVLALLLGLAVTGGLIALVVVMREDRDDPPPLDPIGTATPSTTITAQGGDPTAPDPTVPPSPMPATAPAPGPGPTATGKPKPKADAGAQDAGQVAPFPTFPLPSGLPPLPSGFPPIPTTFPQIPGLPPAQDGKN